VRFAREEKKKSARRRIVRAQTQSECKENISNVSRAYQSREVLSVIRAKSEHGNKESL